MDAMLSDLPIRSIKNFEDVRPLQSALAGSCEGIASIRDFGGLYLVHGKYALEAALQSGARFVSMVDATLQPEFKNKVAEARREAPDLEIEYVKTDFRQPQLYDVLVPTDVSLLYNVLLHQENYISIISGVCSKTVKYVCVAQPCLKEKYFSLPCSTAVIQFWPDELREKFREGAYWDRIPRIARFHPAEWIWAHSASHLVDCFHGFGWQLESGMIIEDALGPHWDYPMLRFTRW